MMVVFCNALPPIAMVTGVVACLPAFAHMYACALPAVPVLPACACAFHPILAAQWWQ